MRICIIDIIDIIVIFKQRYLFYCNSKYFNSEHLWTHDVILCTVRILHSNQNPMRYTCICSYFALQYKHICYVGNCDIFDMVTYMTYCLLLEQLFNNLHFLITWRLMSVFENHYYCTKIPDNHLNKFYYSLHKTWNRR